MSVLLPRSYILNLKCAEFSPEHLWQMRIVTPPARWTTVALPFDELMLTQRGRVELEQREINRDSINGVRGVTGGGGAREAAKSAGSLDLTGMYARRPAGSFSSHA